MPPYEELHPGLLALARALGRYQARQDLAKPAAEEPARTNDIVDGQVVLTNERSFDSAETVEYDLGLVRPCMSRGGAGSMQAHDLIA